MNEVILCKYGEVVLKGTNRPVFESLLLKELRRRASPYGIFKIYKSQSTVFIEPQNEEADLDGMYDAAKRVFGIAGVTRAAVTGQDMERIRETARAYFPTRLAGCRTFRVDAKRADKAFPLTSPEIAAEIGGVILSCVPGIRVDLHHPEEMVRVEIREGKTYLHAGQEKGAGGMPLFTAGRGLLLLSGGIDSPVAGYMMAKRGMEIEAIHFDAFPYTSERSREKVMTLADELCAYCSRIHVHVVTVTAIQEALRKHCQEEFYTLLLRQFMMKLSEKCARQFSCHALITGESLGQVASQTIQALSVTDAATDLPVFRPCIGMDKEEIVSVARKIGTFDTSVLPYEDCCTVFTPRHPKTRPTREQIEAELEKVDAEALTEQAYSTMTTETRRIFRTYR